MKQIKTGMYVTLGEMVYLLMKRNGMSLQELVEKSDVSASIVSELLADVYSNVTVRDVVSIGNVFDLFINVSFRLDEDKVELLGVKSDKGGINASGD